MTTQAQLNQVCKKYIIKHMQPPSNCDINPHEIIEIWVTRYPGLPFVDDNGKFIWAYIMDDAMHWDNSNYATIREARRIYLGFPLPESDKLWKTQLDGYLHSQPHFRRTMSDFIKAKPTGFIHEMESFARMKADK